MKKFLVAASVIMIPSLMVEVGLADEITMTATGNANLYGFYSGAGAFGIGLSGKAALDALQNMNDGSELGAHIELETPNNIQAYLYYKSLFGEVRAGNMSASDHGVDVPGAPDALTTEFTYTGFSNVDKTSFGGISLPVISPAITYASPKFGGFQLGLGADRNLFDASVVSGFNTGGATFNVGAGYSANYTSAAAGVISIGVNSEFSGFELGTKVTHDLAIGVGGTGAEIGGLMNTGPVSVGLRYEVASVNALSKGVATAGVNFTQNALALGANIVHDNSGVALTTASVGAKYTIGKFALGSNAEYKLQANSFAVNGGVDYNLTDNLTLGAGVSYDDASLFSGAAGLSIKF